MTGALINVKKMSENERYPLRGQIEQTEERERDG